MDPHQAYLSHLATPARPRRRFAVLAVVLLVRIGVGITYRGVGEVRSLRCTQRVGDAVQKVTDSVSTGNASSAGASDLTTGLLRDPENLTPEERAIFRAVSMILVVGVINAFAAQGSVDVEPVKREALRVVADTCDAAYLDPIRNAVRDRLLGRVVTGAAPSTAVPRSPSSTTTHTTSAAPAPAPTQNPTDEPTRAPTEGPTDEPTDPGNDLVMFKSPSGNITCVIRDDPYARCDVVVNDWTDVPPSPADCAGIWGLSVALDGDGSRYECAMDPGDVGQPVLDYGANVSLGPITCWSRATGVECTDAETGAGFTVSREQAFFS